MWKQGAQFLFICFPEEIKRMKVHHAYPTIIDKILSLLLF